MKVTARGYCRERERGLSWKGSRMRLREILRVWWKLHLRAESLMIRCLLNVWETQGMNLPLIMRQTHWTEHQAKSTQSRLKSNLHSRKVILWHKINPTLVIKKLNRQVMLIEIKLRALKCLLPKKKLSQLLNIQRILRTRYRRLRSSNSKLFRNNKKSLLLWSNSYSLVWARITPVHLAANLLSNLLSILLLNVRPLLLLILLTKLLFNSSNLYHQYSGSKHQRRSTNQLAAATPCAAPLRNQKSVNR